MKKKIPPFTCSCEIVVDGRDKPLRLEIGCEHKIKKLCWYCKAKPVHKDWLFCKKCGERKDRKVDIIHQGSVTVGINRKPL